MTQEDRDKFITMELDIKYTKESVNKIETSVNNVHSTVNRMAQKLFKDDEMGEEGYFAVIKSNRLRLTKLENVKVAIIAIIGALGGVFGWVANNILNK